jgi:hypothetical protein
MSLFLSLCRSDSVEVLTDGASYDENGTIVDVGEKVVSVNSPPLVITSRGFKYLTDKAEGFVKELCEGMKSFDEALAITEMSLGVLKDFCEGLKAHADAPAHYDIDMMIAGVSEANGPTVAYWATRPQPNAGLDPYHLYRFKTGLLLDLPMSAQTHEEIVSMGGYSNPAVAVRAGEHFRRTLHSLRQDKAPMIVGGHLDLTVVTAKGVSTSRVHVWDDDKIGRPIDPYAADENVVAIRPMNRKQRRAAAKLVA